jgi:hypothetical protein
MLYTSFRIKRETYRKLKKQRNKWKEGSIDETINELLARSEYLDLIIKLRTNEQS